MIRALLASRFDGVNGALVAIMRMTIDMPRVDECDAIGCAYNVERACQARAITIGHGIHPGCDTYVSIGRHVQNDNAATAAGVGACKVEVCRHNENLECTAPSILVEVRGDEGECGTFVRDPIAKRPSAVAKK